MAISTEINTLLTDQIFAIYSHAETLMLERLTKRIARGIKEEGWTERKYREIQEVKREMQALVNDLEKLATTEIDKGIIKAYETGLKSAIKDLNLPMNVLLGKNFIPTSLQRLVLETNNIIVNTNVQILRDTEDVYRTIQSEVASGVLSGTETRGQIAQRALNRFADVGVTSFIDKAHRKWEMASYAEMVTRTVSARAAIQGHIDRQVDAGRDLVIVSAHFGACPLCRPWAGEILSISGTDMRYTPLEVARSKGLFHPNCRHTLTGYIPGLTEVEPKGQGNGDPEMYEYTQRQRANERAIRQWKRRQVVALGPQEAAKARAKVTYYQGQQRALLEEYEAKFGVTLRRKYNRESITNRTGRKDPK